MRLNRKDCKRRAPRFCAEPMEPRVMLAASFVADLNKASSGNLIGMLGHIGNLAIFVEKDGVHGREPYSTDGTKAGTVLLRDINVGIGWSNPEFVATIGKTMFFRATDIEGPPSLWKTDGTAAGTMKVSNVAPFDPPAFIGKEMLYIASRQPEGKDGLWKTDGSSAGTVHLSDIGGGGSSFITDGIVATHGKVFFAGNDTAHGTELWTSDGTVAGTRLFADLLPGPKSGNPSDFTTTSDRLYFLDNIENSSKQHLWKADGISAKLVETVGTRTDNISDAIGQLTPIGDTLYFTEDESAHFPDHDSVWRTTGKAGTLLRLARLRDPEIVEFDPNGPARNRIYVGENRQKVYSIKGDTVKAVANVHSDSFFDSEQVGNDFYFRTLSDDQSSVDVFRANAEDGKVLLKHLAGVVEAKDFSAAGSKVFFVTASALWITDGTAANTVEKVFPDDRNLLLRPFEPDHRIVVGSSLYFAAESGASGKELWVSDGSLSGTHLIRDIDPSSESSNPRMFTAGVGGAYFIADSGTYPPNKTGVYFYSESTRKVTELIAPGLDRAPFIGKLGAAEIIVTDRGIFSSDGTEAGTKQILSGFGNPAIVGSTLYLNRGGDLFKSDGTTSGTVKLASGFIDGPSAALNNLLIFQGAQSVGGVFTESLWRSDGTTGGTKSIAKVIPSKFFNFGGAVYFLVDEGGIGDTPTEDLWRTDGTAKGTKLIKAGFVQSNFGGNLVAVTTDSIYLYNGADLWRSDGTTAGTKHLKHFPSADFVKITSIAAVGNRVYFPALSSSGYELWTSSGGKTVMLKDINPGIDYSVVYSPAEAGKGDPEISVDMAAAPSGKLYFAADDGEHGLELWVSDGTTKGTKLVQDLLPGSSVSGSLPSQLGVTGKTLLFGADDGLHGTELWQLPLS